MFWEVKKEKFNNIAWSTVSNTLYRARTTVQTHADIKKLSSSF